MSSHDDPILDGLLAELLAGQTPPDLSGKILQRLAHRNGSGAPAADAPIAPQPAIGLSQGLSPMASNTRPQGAAPRIVASTPRTTAGRSRSNLMTCFALAAAAGVLLVVGLWALVPSRTTGSHSPDAVASSTAGQNDQAAIQANREEPVDLDGPAATDQAAFDQDPAEDSQPAAMPENEGDDFKPSPSEFLVGDDRPGTRPVDDSGDDASAKTVLASPLAGQDSPRKGSHLSDEEVIALINSHIQKGWSDHQITPSPPATEGEWLRRLFLDVLGRIPSLEETLAFQRDKDPEKRAKLVDRLLNSDEYIEEYARNWTTVWTNTLIGRTGGDNEDSMANRQGLQQYLRRAMLTNKPYNQIVLDLLTATGNNTPGQEDYNGAVNFLLNEIDLEVPANERTARVTAKVARIFLGLQVQCTQCHNHPFNDWKQDQFWSFDAFFRQMVSLRSGGEGGPVVLTDADFAGESGNPEEADIFFEQRNGLLRVAYPRFVDGTEIPRAGYVDEVNRRQELAKLIIKSEYMKQAAVNRMWGHFLGYGFTKPVDDTGPHNQPSHPELLTDLADAFGYSYDLRQLIKWIVLSEPYALSSRVGSKNAKDDPDLGEPPLFSRFYLRQMRAEELFQSLLVATEAHKTGDYQAQEEAKRRWLDQFVTAFGNDEGGEATTFNGTIPQALMMMNGELMKQAMSTEPGTFLGKLATAKIKDSQKIQYLFLAGLCRAPTTSEQQVAQQLWLARKGDTNEALKDIWWAVLNSNEFILNH